MGLKQIVPELLVEDMDKTLKFYQEILGFKIETIFPDNNPTFARIVKDNISIMFYSRKKFEDEVPPLKNIKMGGTFILFIEVAKNKEFYQQIKEKVTIITAFHETDYGSQEFTISDCNGYFITFSEEI